MAKTQGGTPFWRQAMAQKAQAAQATQPSTPVFLAVHAPVCLLDTSQTFLFNHREEF